jgi:hypothetical protein
LLGRFPDFLGIGAQKAGTTWLHANLGCHPEVFLPEPKELHYFNGKPRLPLAFYKAKFRKAGTRTCGEITPAYGHLPEPEIARIRGLNPNLKLLLMLRNPVARAWSGAVMQLATFQGKTEEDIPEREFLEYLQSDHSVARTSYLKNLAAWEEHFPKQQFFIGFFEDLKRRPWELLLDVFQHLEISTDVDPAGFLAGERVMPITAKEGLAKSKGTSQGVPAFAADFLGELYKDEIAQLKQRFGEPCTEW